VRTYKLGLCGSRPSMNCGDRPVAPKPTSILQSSPAVLAVAIALADTISYPDNDLWGHIRFGQAMLTAGHMIRTDPYSYSAVGHLWVDHEWFTEIIMATAYDSLEKAAKLRAPTDSSSPTIRIVDLGIPGEDIVVDRRDLTIWGTAHCGAAFTAVDGRISFDRPLPIVLPQSGQLFGSIVAVQLWDSIDLTKDGQVLFAEIQHDSVARNYDSGSIAIRAITLPPDSRVPPRGILRISFARDRALSTVGYGINQIGGNITGRAWIDVLESDREDFVTYVGRFLVPGRRSVGHGGPRARRRWRGARAWSWSARRASPTRWWPGSSG
jgi:hypothetical protein